MMIGANSMHSHGHLVYDQANIQSCTMRGHASALEHTLENVSSCRSDTVALECSLLPAMAICGALLASLGLMLSGNVIGRRMELLLAACVYGRTITTLCMYISISFISASSAGASTLV